ncbi:MAG: ATP-grasp domain-containing protein [Candidatus Latescibacterota bacterium]
MRGTGPLLVVQPSRDYAERVLAAFPEAALLATPQRAGELPGVHRIAARLGDPVAALRAVTHWSSCHGLRLGGIVSFVCEYLPLTGLLAEALDLAFHDSPTVQRTRHKDLAAATWNRAGVPTPATRPVRTLEELRGFAAGVPPPWILKPTAGTGSEWVLRVDRREDLADAHARICAGLRDGDPGPALTYLAQALATGREFGADLFVEDGHARVLRLTEKCLLPAAGLGGLVAAYFVPELDAATHGQLQDVLERGAAALGVRRGIVMADVVLTASGPQLLEMALRPGGDCLPALTRHVLGYDPVLTACRVALGGRPEPPAGGPRPRVAALHLMADRSGTVRRLDCGRLVAHPAVVELIEVYHGPGERVRCWEGSYDDRILAACLVRYEDPSELAGLSALLTRYIDLELEEESTCP